MGNLSASAGAVSDPCIGCTNETWEGTGTSVAGWVYGGDAASVTNVDYATAPAPLVGSQSLLIRNPASLTSYCYLNFPSSTVVYGRFKFCMTNTVVTNMNIAIIADNGFSAQAYIRVMDGGALAIVSGTIARTVTTITADRTNCVWWRCQKGTGANAQIDIGLSFDGIKPTSGNGFATRSDGTAAANIVQIGPYVTDANFGSGRPGVIYDSWSVSTTGPIGNF